MMWQLSQTCLARKIYEGQEGAIGKVMPKLRVHLPGRSLILAIAVLGLCGCSRSPGEVTTSSVNPSGTALESRPLHLPSIPTTAPCPVSPETNLPTRGVEVNGMPVPEYGFGRGPVYLSGQLAWFAGVFGMLVVSPTYSGPALARGHRLDESGGFPFTSPAGKLVIPEAKGTKGWRILGSSINQKVAPGCYGVQVDGSNFSDVIVFVIQSGPVPAG